jgi:hypothetical protein
LLVLNALDNEQIKDIEIVQRKTIEEIKSYLSKFNADFKPVYTAEEFVHVDSNKYYSNKFFFGIHVLLNLVYP